MDREAEPVDQHPTRISSMRLASDASQIAEARRFVHDEVSRRHAMRVSDAELLTSEAVGNAVQHAATDAITVTVADIAEVVRVLVHDDDPTPPTVVAPDPATVGGNGMNLIDQLAAQWGVTQVEGDGKTLWFDIERDVLPPPRP